ncbi:MAG: flagellar hook-basal body complex protein FliE [Sphingomonas sp.]
MTGLEAIGAIGAIGAPAEAAPVTMQLGGLQGTHQAGGASFGDILMSGLRGVDEKVATADKLVARFAVDDSVPVHQVTIALAEAKLSVDLAMQVRSRLVEGYRELMNMQL